MYEVESEEVNGYTVRVVLDETDGDSPRDWDNLGTIVYTSTRYVLGDVQCTPEEIDEVVNDPEVVYLPVYAYIHSGVRLSTGPFRCPWDSGQCGIIYVSYEDIRKEYGVKRVTKKLRERVSGYLEGEVKTFDRYLSGQVYGFEIEDIETGDVVESCYGFYGEPSEVLEEAKGIAESLPLPREVSGASVA
jgi:hypothetical protein